MQEAADHDGQILDKYNSDMDIVLIFVRPFGTTSILAQLLITQTYRYRLVFSPLSLQPSLSPFSRI
jgi:hypothetical protein